MDRLDVWLNAQRGWRRLALMWLPGYSFSWLVSDCWLAPQNFDASKVPSARYLFWVAIISVPCSLLFAGLALWMQARYTRSCARRGKPRMPTFTWRMMGYGVLWTVGLTIQLFSNNQAIAWRHQHSLVDVIGLVLLVSSVALVLDNLRYTLRLRAQLSSSPMASPPPFPESGPPLG